MSYSLRASQFIVAVMASTAMSACWLTKSQPKANIVVPSAAISTPEYRGDGSIPRQRYVIRMSDGQRDWEVEFPEVAAGYEMQIPLKNQPAGADDDLIWESASLTEADKELLEQLRRETPAMEREGVFVGGRNINDPVQQPVQQPAQQSAQRAAAAAEPAAQPQPQPPKAARQRDGTGPAETAPAPTRPSYFLSIAEVRRLYASGNYELAMVRLTKLAQAYPDDVQILSMKGSLWLKLRRPALARQAWEQVLQVDPDNQAVIEALKRLD